MTGRINLTPEAERQLNEIDDWIAQTATADIARRFVAALLLVQGPIARSVPRRVHPDYGDVSRGRSGRRNRVGSAVA